MTTMVMPMAGSGLRTSGKFDGPKPLIVIDGFPMFYWAAKNINVDKQIFIVRRDHVISHNIDKIVKKYFPKSKVIIQEEILGGQLLSAMLAKEYLETEEDIVIVDCDMYSEINFDEIKEIDADCSIVTFNNNSTSYSYVDKKNDLVKSIAEKESISNEAVAGIFYWKRGYSFLNEAKRCIENNIKTNNEYYVSGVYLQAIKNNCKVKTLLSEITYDLSTDEGVDRFMLHRGLR